RGGNLSVNAFVSGVAARVAFVRGDTVSYFDADQPDDVRECAIGDLGVVLAGASDLVQLKSTDFEGAVACLLDLWNKDRALRLLQVILESCNDEEFIADAFHFLDDLLHKQ